MNAATTAVTARASAGWMGTAALVVLLALVTLFVADRMYDPQRFPIERIEVHGRIGTDASRAERVEQVRAAVAESLDGNYFSSDLTAIERRVERLPWVFRAAVRRRWPDALAIEVTEVQPVARWGARQMLHASGDLVARDAAAFDVSDFDNLPLLSGPASRKDAVWRAYRRWSEVFAANGLALEQLRFDPRGLWHLQLSVSALARASDADVSDSAPTTMIVEHDGAEPRLARFIAALQHDLIGSFADMQSVDLRYPNGFAIARRDAANVGADAAAESNLHLANHE